MDIELTQYGLNCDTVEVRYQWEYDLAKSEILVGIFIWKGDKGEKLVKLSLFILCYVLWHPISFIPLYISEFSPS